MQVLSAKDGLSPNHLHRSRLRRSSALSSAEVKRVHVAAVCFRVRSGELEFLLVRTRKGSWTFPKGGVDGDATHADAAAREAYEEAGVRGWVERVPFISYWHCKLSEVGSGREVILVHAYLCQVKRLISPSEQYRDPTWFREAKAKRQLRKLRTPEFAAEVISVIDRAKKRIRSRSPK